MKRVWLLAALAMLAGCVHLGPKTVAVDRFDYSISIADSWKQQTPLNIVKLRYMEPERALTAVMFMFTLADTGTADRLPRVTIPAQ